MKSFKQYLREGISPILFHYTSIGSIVTILEKNQFLLTTSLGTNSEKGHKWYFLSTARSTASSYFSSAANGYGYLVLDGRALASNLPGKPVDYWGPEFKNDEMEDRIYSDNVTIPNARKYIQEIHLAWKTTKYPELNDHHLRALRSLKIQCIRLNIPLYIYDDRKAFLSRNTARAIDVDADELKTQEPYRPGYSSMYRGGYEEWAQLVHAKTYDELGDYAKSSARSATWRSSELLTRLKNDIHNQKDRGRAEPILNLLRLVGANSPEEFIEWIVTKWKDRH